MASAKRSIDEADFEQPSCSKKARFDGERQSSASLLFSHQNAEIYNLNTPATLLNRSSQVLASHFNDNNECIPQEWFDWIQALVCVYLKPSLFLHFVVRGGGIVALRNNFSNIEFQPMLQKLFQTFCSSILPLRMFSSYRLEVERYRISLGIALDTDHCFHRLGLNDYRQLDFVRARNSDDPAFVNRDCSVLCLKFYRAIASGIPANLDLHLPALPLEIEKLISISQNKFLRFPVNNAPSANGLTLLEEFNRMPRREQCYKILHASQVAQLKLKYHVSMYLWFYLLSSEMFRTNSEMRMYKLYVYQGLAVSFAVFHCNYNATFEWLRRMRTCIIYPSDYIQWMLARQRVLSILGFIDEENVLFEHMWQEKRILPQSNMYKRFLTSHVGCVLRHCVNQLVELWCEKMVFKLGSGNRDTQHFLSVFDQTIRPMRDRLAKLEQILSESIACSYLPKSTQNFAKASLLAKKLILGELYAINDCPWKAKVMFRVLQNSLPPRTQKFSFEYLVEAYLLMPNYTNKRFDDFGVNYRRSLDKDEEKSDWKDHLITGNACFEKLCFLLTTGLHDKCRLLTMEYVDTCIRVFESVSGHQPHPRLALVMKVKDILNGCLKNNSCFVGTCSQQTEENASVMDASEISNLAELSDNQLFNYLIKRERPYIQDILAFGRQSIVNGNCV